MARPTSDPKRTGIRVRINEETICWLNEESEKRGITVSELIRTCVKNEKERK